MSSHHFTNKKTEAQRVEPEIGILVHMIYCRSILKRRGERKQIRKGEGGKWKHSLCGVYFNLTPLELWQLGLYCTAGSTVRRG